MSVSQSFESFTRRENHQKRINGVDYARKDSLQASFILNVMCSDRLCSQVGQMADGFTWQMHIKSETPLFCQSCTVCTIL